MTFDPYVVQDTTWTREELLRARGEKVRHTTHRNRSPRHDTRAA